MTAIDPFASVRAPATTTPTAKSPDDQFGKDTFLKLLVAQLRFQNPMSPTDPSQFLAQTAQFTMVEKLIAIENQSKDAARANEVLASSALIGRSVTFGIGTGEEPAPIATTKIGIGGNLPTTATAGTTIDATTDIFSKNGNKLPVKLQFVRLADVPDGTEWEVRVMNGSQQLGAASTITFDASGERTSGDIVVTRSALEGIAGTEGTWPEGGISIGAGAASDPARLRVGGGAATAAVREQNGSDGLTLTGIVTAIRFDDQDGALLRIGNREISLASILEVHPPSV